MEEERRNLEPGVGRSTRRRREASGQKETGEGSRRDDALTQERAPIYEALEAFQKMRVVPFDVPGHKRARQPGADETFRRDLHAAGRQFHEAAR